MTKYSYQVLTPLPFEGDGRRPLECLITRCLLHSRLDMPDKTLSQAAERSDTFVHEAIIVYLSDVVIRYTLGQVPIWLTDWMKVGSIDSMPISPRKRHRWFRYHADDWLLTASHFPVSIILRRYRASYGAREVRDVSRTACERASLLYQAACAYLDRPNVDSILHGVYRELADKAELYRQLLEFFAIHHYQLLHAVQIARLNDPLVQRVDTDYLLDLWLQYKQHPQPEVLVEMKRLSLLLNLPLPLESDG